MVRAASRVPPCMPWIQLLPGTKSHACTRTRCPSSSKSQAIHSAQARSACVYDMKKSDLSPEPSPRSIPEQSHTAGPAIHQPPPPIETLRLAEAATHGQYLASLPLLQR